MPKFDVLVPRGRTALVVKADGEIATLFTVNSPSGFGFDIQTWETLLPGDPQQIVIIFAPRS
jgi:hypothetical protein